MNKMKMRPLLPWLVAFAMAGVLAIVSWQRTGRSVYTAQVNLPIERVSWVANSPLKEQYGEYADDAFRKNPDLTEKIRQVRPKFNPDEMRVSSPTKVARLNDGRSFALITGCRQHDCPGYMAEIAIEAQSQKIYLLESEFLGEGRESKITFSGEPDDAVQELLRAALRPQ